MKLSIIVPIYNSSKYLRDCIDSILNQSYKNYELILVDDGSTDNSAIICKEYEKKYDNIKYIYKINEGACYARKEGAKLSSGEYLGFIDSDDTIRNDFFENLMSYTDKAEIVCSGMTIQDTVLQDDYLKGLYVENKELIYRTMIFNTKERRSGMLCSLCTKVIKKDIYIEAVKDICLPNKLWEDLSYLYKIVLKANSIYITDYVGYIYRQNTESVSHTYKSTSFKEAFEALEYSLDRYSNEAEIVRKQLVDLRSYVLFTEVIRMADESKNYIQFKQMYKENNVGNKLSYIDNSNIRSVLVGKQANLYKIICKNRYFIFYIVKSLHLIQNSIMWLLSNMYSKVIKK